ncbi:MAG: long-chain fatty acid--CoA ligase [Bacteroidia bacterium]
MYDFRIFDILPRYAEKFPQPDALASKVNNEWVKISTADFIVNSNFISCGLLQAGIKAGDKIATISNNRYEWNFLDMGMLQIGAIHVPIYPTISEADYRFILNDAEVKLVFVSSEELFLKIKNIASEIPTINNLFTFDSVIGAKSWTEILEAGKKVFSTTNLNALKAAVKPDDIATLIYTSGTTGTPKGVILSHKNIMSNVIAVEDLPPIDNQAKALSFLPINHVYERMLTYLYMYLGVSIYYAESIDKLIDNIKEVKPEVFSTVPRLLEKIYEKIVATGSGLKGIKKIIFFWALNLGLRYELDGKNGWWYAYQLSIANKLVFSKWREALGGNVRAIVSGSAPLQPRLARVFWAAKIIVLEGYGLTETSPVISVNTTAKGGAKFGTVGPIIKDVEVKIAADGEILVKGPNVMLGYYKRPDLTVEVIDSEGWFHTGDIGLLEDGKYLKITDRKKELLKTSGGKYIAPQPIENKFKESHFMEQIMVVGDGQKFAGALVIPAFPYLKEWCNRKNIPYTSNAEMIKNPLVIARFKKEIGIMNPNFGHVEQIKEFALIADEWSVNTGELTPTLKLKRKFILAKYKNLMDKMYS